MSLKYELVRIMKKFFYPKEKTDELLTDKTTIQIQKSQISDFPSTIPASAHTHTKSEITDFPVTIPAESHAHGNINNNGVIIGANAKNVVTDSNGKIIAEAKPVIPVANDTASNIQMDGNANAGNLSTFAKADHIHPTDTSRAGVNHTHTKSEITDFPSTLTPNSHVHGNITNEGVLLGQSNKNVVTNSEGKIIAEAKPVIPVANDTASNIQMDGNANAGNLSTFAKADHIHPTDTSRAGVNHTHTKSEITDFSETISKTTMELPSFASSGSITLRKWGKLVIMDLNLSCDLQTTDTTRFIGNIPEGYTPPSHLYSHNGHLPYNTSSNPTHDHVASFFLELNDNGVFQLKVRNHSKGGQTIKCQLVWFTN